LVGKGPGKESIAVPLLNIEKSNYLGGDLLVKRRFFDMQEKKKKEHLKGFFKKEPFLRRKVKLLWTKNGGGCNWKARNLLIVGGGERPHY